MYDLLFMLIKVVCPHPDYVVEFIPVTSLHKVFPPDLSPTNVEWGASAHEDYRTASTPGSLRRGF
ncbi:hypothetical protein [Aliihoeflea sp. PC F10.4]